MNPKSLVTQFTFNHRAFSRNVAGITADESVWAPAGGGNCLNWVAGHIVATRDGLLQVLGAPPCWKSEAAKRYARGGTPITGAADAEPWENLLRLFDESQKLVVEKVSSLDANALAAAPPPDRNPFRSDDIHELIATYTFHESYHVGQTGLLRRLLGKEGGIK